MLCAAMCSALFDNSSAITTVSLNMMHRSVMEMKVRTEKPSGRALQRSLPRVEVEVEVTPPPPPPPRCLPHSLSRAGFLDWVPKKMQRVGCMELLNTVQRRVQPKVHVFGHIHEGKVLIMGWLSLSCPVSEPGSVCMCVRFPGHRGHLSGLSD